MKKLIVYAAVAVAAVVITGAAYFAAVAQQPCEFGPCVSTKAR